MKRTCLMTDIRFITTSAQISVSLALIQSANQHSHMAFFGLGNG